MQGFGWKARRKETTRKRFEVNIKMGLREIGWGCMDWIHLPRGRDPWRAFVNTVMNLQVS
jgi:hypothetical protein